MAKKRPRKSVSLKEQAVLRLLKGEDLEWVSRESGLAMHELAQWREKYMLEGRENLKSHPRDIHNMELEQRDQLVTKLALENEILKKARGDRGKPQAVDRLSQETPQRDYGFVSI